jgi:hypothetical protein
VGWDANTAREHVRVARALGGLPAIDEALRTGRLSYAKVRALTRVATPETEGKLLSMALFATASQLERLCRAYRGVLEAGGAANAEERCVRRRTLPGGKVKLELVLEADEAELVLKAVDRAREVRAEQARQAGPAAGGGVSAETRLQRRAETPWPTQADGMVRLAESFLAGNPVAGNGGERFQVMVHLDQEVLGPDGALGGTLEDGSRVSEEMRLRRRAETLRRVACDCGLVAVHHDGQRLDIGRRSRSIPPAIRRALRLRDHGCAFPGCTHTRFVHAHHVEHWLHGGRTSVGNLVQLCSFQPQGGQLHRHHLVHEGGWRVTAEAEGELVFRSPRGKPLGKVPAREDLQDAPAWLSGWAQENNLAIDARTNFPMGDGKEPDYGIAVDSLLDTG